MTLQLDKRKFVNLMEDILHFMVKQIIPLKVITFQKNLDSQIVIGEEVGVHITMKIMVEEVGHQEALVMEKKARVKK